MYIREFFKFSKEFINGFKDVKLSTIGEIVFRRTYAQRGERWSECVLRVIEGNMSILKTHCVTNNLYFDEDYWSGIAESMANDMVVMKWCTGGRILKNLGSDKVINDGSLSLNNCSAISTKKSLSKSAVFMLNFLKDQAGVGFDTTWNGILYESKDCHNVYVEVIDPVIIVRGILEAFESKLTNLPIYKNIKGKRLQILNDNLIKYCKRYADYCKNNDFKCDRSRLILDIMNSIGVYVGGTHNRRSAQIAIGDVNDDTFLNLKNYDIYDRSDIGWASNNSVIFEEPNDFLRIPEISERIKSNGEPGLINGINMKKFGRMGKEFEEYGGRILSMSEDVSLTNPCGEISLEPYELCNLSTTVPTKCESIEEWFRVIKHATIFSSIISLLMTKYPETNKVVSKNRRIGVGISGMAEWFEEYHTSEIISFLKGGYSTVREVNIDFAESMGIPIAKKVTTVKPDGNLSLLMDVSPGIHYPPFNKYCIRRIQVRKTDEIVDNLKSRFPFEELISDNSQYIFEIPHKSDTKSVMELSIWEQLRYNEIVQRFWSDNSVSFTGRFTEEEGVELENIISMTMPFIKTISFLPQDDEYLKEKYKQLPYEDISEDEYLERKGSSS